MSKVVLTHPTIRSLGKHAMPLGGQAAKLEPQATNHTKEQFANSPDLHAELMNAIMDALDAHTTMSTQALNSQIVQRGRTSC